MSGICDQKDFEKAWEREKVPCTKTLNYFLLFAAHDAESSQTLGITNALPLSREDQGTIPPRSGASVSTMRKTARRSEMQRRRR